MTMTNAFLFMKDLKASRIRAGLSMRELAPMIGISFSAIARIERGYGTLTPDTAHRVKAWIEVGKSSGPKIKRRRSWIIGVEERLARIETKLEKAGI